MHLDVAPPGIVRRSTSVLGASEPLLDRDEQVGPAAERHGSGSVELPGRMSSDVAARYSKGCVTRQKKAGPVGPAICRVAVCFSRSSGPPALVRPSGSEPSLADPFRATLRRSGCRYVCLWMYVTVAIKASANSNDEGGKALAAVRHGRNVAIDVGCHGGGM